MEIELDMQLHAFFQLPKAMETLNAQTELAGKTLIPIKKGSVLPGSCKKTSERLHFKSKPCMKEIKGIIPSPVQWSILYATRQQWNSRRRCARQTHTLVRNIAATMTLTMKSCNCKQSKKSGSSQERMHRRCYCAGGTTDNYDDIGFQPDGSFTQEHSKKIVTLAYLFIFYL